MEERSDLSGERVDEPWKSVGVVARLAGAQALRPHLDLLREAVEGLHELAMPARARGLLDLPYYSGGRPHHCLDQPQPRQHVVGAADQRDTRDTRLRLVLDQPARSGMCDDRSAHRERGS